MNNLFARFLTVLFLLTSVHKVQSQRTPLPCLEKKFDLLVHIVLDEEGDSNITREDIEEELISLNQAFAPICISFEVCEYRYIDNWQYDTLTDYPEWQKHLQTKYHEKNRINLFLVTDLDAPSSCGISNFSGISNIDSASIAIEKSCIVNFDHALSHEMGHIFGLYDTSEGIGEELADGSNCSNDNIGDLICDTPADPFDPEESIDNYINDNCRFTSEERDANGHFYAPLIDNIMSYYYPCSCKFTYEQYQAMSNTYLISDPKIW